MMNLYLSNAIKEEERNNYLEAIALYEEAIKAGQQNIDVYINLSFLYWQIAAQFTFRDEFNIPDHYVNKGADRFALILEGGLTFYPKDRELIFWKLYYPHRMLFDLFSYDQAVSIVEMDDGRNSLVPYFFLYLFDKNKFEKERNELLDQCTRIDTAKHRYIISIIG